MDKQIKFFTEFGNLKFYPRRGWLLREIKNPETIADHVFMVTLLIWLFSFDRGFNIRRLFKLSLVHSLPAINLKQIPSYDHLLKVRSQKETIKKYPALTPRTSISDKIDIFEKRYEQEKSALKNFLNIFPSEFSDELLRYWDEYRTGASKEAQFLSAVDKLENLIQAIIYKDQLGKKGVESFWSQCYEITHDSQLLGFIGSLQEYYERGEKSVKNKKNLGLIKFIFQAAKLKTIRRKGWILRGVRNPDSIASHCIRSIFLNWFLSYKKHLDFSVLTFMTIIHDLYTSNMIEVTPHDISIKESKDIKKEFEKFPWLGHRGQKVLTMKKFLELESDAIDAIIKPLPHQHRHEIKYLWLEYRTGASKEGRFARQVDRIETVMQAMEYFKENKKVSPTSFWLGLKEIIDEPILLEFVENLDNYYFSSKH